MDAPIIERPAAPMTLPLLLSGTVNPGAHRTLVSELLTFSYVIDRITVVFPIGSDHLVQVTPILSLDPSVSLTGPPIGNRLFSYCSVATFIVGDSATFDFPMSLHVPQRGTWLKAHLYNGDAFMHRIAAIFSVRELLEE